MRAEHIRLLLEEGAARPTRAVDVGVILEEGRDLHRRRMISVTAIGLAVIVGLGFLTANLADRVDRLERSDRPQPAAAFPQGWTRLSLPPEVRAGAGLVWTGSEMLAWGGCDPTNNKECVPTSDGYSFDPASRTWGPLDAAPTASAHADAVWTGTEAIFLGVGGTDRLEGQAFDPASEEWRTLATAPIPARSSALGAVAVWTGSEVIFWGGGDQDGPTVRGGAAYDPATDTWRRIADAPLGLNHASGMWTGREMLVFGSLLNGRNVSETPTSVGAAYDPTTDSWRELPPSELSPQAASAVWVGDRMVAWDYEPLTQEYDPETSAWTDPVKMPFRFDECYPDSAVVSDLAFAFYCGQAAIYDPASSAWDEIHGGALEEEVRPGGYKLWRFAELVPAGETLFLLAEGLTISESGDPCYGCAGSPASFWAYRPPGE